MKFLVSLSVFLFLQTATAHDFITICNEMITDPHSSPGFECSLYNNNVMIGGSHVELKQKQQLWISFLGINKKFRRLGLSSILLYHTIKEARKFFGQNTIKTLALLDRSSLSNELGIDHYERYGFIHIGNRIFSMPIKDFLQHPKNLERYHLLTFNYYLI